MLRLTRHLFTIERTNEVTTKVVAPAGLSKVTRAREGLLGVNREATKPQHGDGRNGDLIREDDIIPKTGNLYSDQWFTTLQLLEGFAGQREEDDGF